MPQRVINNQSSDTLQEWYDALCNLLHEEEINLNNADNWHRIQIVDKAAQTSERFSRSAADNDVSITHRLMNALGNGKSVYVIGSNGPKELKLNESSLDPELGDAPADPGREPEEAPAPTRWQRFANKCTFGLAYRNVFHAHERSQTERVEYAAKRAEYDTIGVAVRDFRNGELDLREREFDNRMSRAREDVSNQMVTGKYHEPINNQRTSSRSAENVNNFEHGNK